MYQRIAPAMALLGVMLWGVPVNAQVSVAVVVPAAQATEMGDSGNQFPFNPRSVGVSTIRYQQVYSASEFAPGTYTITQIAFRTTPLDAPFSGTTGTLQVDLSTTSASPDHLSTTFSDNLGADTQTVFNGPWEVSTTNSGVFDLVLTLTTPFVYNPALGNLLLDVRNFGGGSIDVLNNSFITLDAQSTPGDSTSRIYTAQSIDGVLLTTGVPDPLESLGLVTKFVADFTPSLAPQQQVQTLIDRLEALVAGGVLNAGQANGLTRPLSNAQRSLEADKLAPACSQIADFMANVDTLVREGVLSTSDGGALWSAAEAIRASLGCS